MIDEADEYTVLIGPIDGSESRKAWVMKNGYCVEMRKSLRSAKWVATRMAKGLMVPDEDKMTPEEIKAMEEDETE